MSDAQETALDPLVREIGRRVERMAERTRDEEGYFPHPIAVAMAEAIRGGHLTDGDGSFAAAEGPFQVVMSKRHGHFALLDVTDLRVGKVLANETVLRLLTAHDVLATHPGDSVDAVVAHGLLSGLLGLDDASSALLLAKAGLAGPTVPKRALLEVVQRLPP